MLRNGIFLPPITNSTETAQENDMTYKLVLLFLLCTMAMPLAGMAADETKKDENKEIVMETSMGDITIVLFDKDAPISATNFRTYVKEKFFDGLTFHRVIPGFVIQGGGFEPGMVQRQPTHPPIINEADNGIKNTRGTLSMARTQVVNSATSQFFVNLVDNKVLDNRGKTAAEFGYAVFGKVVSGMEVVDKIAGVPTGTAGFHRDVPKADVIIKRAYEK